MSAQERPDVNRFELFHVMDRVVQESSGGVARNGLSSGYRAQRVGVSPCAESKGAAASVATLAGYMRLVDSQGTD